MNIPQINDTNIGEFILLHSGYGGGQYVGRVTDVVYKGVQSAGLLLAPRVMRYQPRESTGGSEYVCYWNEVHPQRGHIHPAVRDGDNFYLHVKENDRLYSLGKGIDLDPFIESQDPINPENPIHRKALTGNIRKFKLLYEGSELRIVA